MIEYFENFLTKEECETLISYIESSNQRSAVVGENTDRTSISEYRTSHTSNLPKIPLVEEIKNKIGKIVGKESSYGEALQGQVYAPGQFFKPHTDFFESSAYNKHCLASGNRTDTFMIYLNDVEEGGETNFTNLNISVKPKQGLAIKWPNLKDGKLLQDSMHEGSSVIKGKKYVITSWWRENQWNPSEDAYLYNLSKKEVQKPMEFNEKTVPRLTEKGYKVVKIPKDIWELVLNAYEQVKPLAKDETFPGKDYFIPGHGVSSTLMSLDYIPELRDSIHSKLLSIHEDFCNEELIPTALYGIRSYNRHATLTAHVDKAETHHISSVIVVDKDLACGCKAKPNADDWALEIQNHQGEWEKVYAQPGEMILYESLACPHGRSVPFGGTYFRSIFGHYKFKNYKYTPQS